MRRLLLQVVVLAVVAVVAWAGWQYLQAGAQSAQPATSSRAAVVVRTAVVGTAAIADRVEAVGTTRAWEAVNIAAETSGRIASINFEQGQRVEAGHLLIELDAEAEKAQLQELKALRDDAERQLERSRQLLSSRNVAPARVDELRAGLAAANARVARIESMVADKEIKAPFAGVVGLRQVSLGAVVDGDTVITTLDDVSQLRLDFAVPERFLGQLRSGVPVTARSAAFPDRTFEGEVAEINTRIDPATRSVRVQGKLPNDDGALLPGMFLNVSLVLAQRPDAVVIPEQSLVPIGDKQYVYVITGDKAERREVTTGVRRRGEVEITQGLTPGEQVVTSGVQRLRDGATVTVQQTTDGSAAPSS